MAVEIREISSKHDLKSFINLPWQLYRGDRNWVPPLKSDLLGTLLGNKDTPEADSPRAYFMAYQNGRAVGRLGVGINDDRNFKKQRREGYITLFESVNDEAVSAALFDAASSWLKTRGIDSVKGPMSPNSADDLRGLLVEGFDGPPVFMNSYNRPYYAELFEHYGFSKYEDYYAYYLDARTSRLDTLAKIVDYASQKYGFYVKSVKLQEIELAVRDIKRILDTAMPEEWADLTPPSLEELRAEAERLRVIFQEDDLQIAYSKEGMPIGFMLALNDYNQVLKRLDGRLFPFGILKFYWYRRRITAARIFNLFVVPEYENKGVPFAFFVNFFFIARKRGYRYGEGSTIGEHNKKARRVVERAGGLHYRTYRIYLKAL
ncbi:MAG: N-acetyltransferase [Thermacetogeniaceae bacterium]